MDYLVIDDWEGIINHQSLFDEIVASEDIAYYKHKTTNEESAQYNFFGHNIMSRLEQTNFIPSPQSPLFFDTFRYVHELCLSKNIPMRGLGRASVNINYSDDTKYMGAIHVDHDFHHLQILTYLNDSDGETILFDKRFDGNNNFIEDGDYPILAKITPKKGRILVFDGSLYHTATPPSKGLRMVLVSTVYS